MIGLLIPILILAGIGGIVWYFYMKVRYRTAKSNQALIITGPNLGDKDKDPNIFSDNEGRSMKIIRGGGYKLKFFQNSTPVDLTSFQLSLTTPKVYTQGGVPIVADAVAMVKVADTLKGIANYAEQFLGKKQKEIEHEIAEVLGSNLRAILSRMTVEDINADREGFNREVTEIAQKQLDEMGFRITSLGLTDLRDADPENGYLENLGRPRIAEMKKVAEIAEADNDRETRIHKAKTDQEAKQEEYVREIAIAEAKKEKDLKDAAFKEETERARAKSEQSYALEKTKLEKEVLEEELKLEAKRKEEALRLQQLEKERLVLLEVEQAKIRKEQADADFYAAMKKAEAEAKVIESKGEAEAKARKLLAEAMDKHGEVVILEKLIEMLPLLAEKVSEPLNNVDSIKIIDTGTNGEATTSLSKSVVKNMLHVQEPLKELTGIDMKQLLETFVSKGKNVDQEKISFSKEKEKKEEVKEQTEN